MNLLKRIQEFASFTKNEQKVFLFLAIVFLSGVSIKVYKAYFKTQPVPQFDYSSSDKEFAERSKQLASLTPGGEASGSETRSDDRPITKVINLNTATKKDLVALPGIGEGIAEELMLYRDEHGAFSSIEELKKVKGIGAKKFEKIRPYVDIK